MSKTADAYQALFDLMANAEVRLHMEGRLGEVWATVEVRRTGWNDWREAGAVGVVESAADALEELHAAGAFDIPAP